MLKHHKVDQSSKKSESSQNLNHSPKVDMPIYFECPCGRKYLSLQAVDTHIKNKHSAEKKKYCQDIKNPRKPVMEQLQKKIDPKKKKTQVRTQHIKYDPMYVQLKYLAKNAVLSVRNHYMKAFKDKKQKENGQILIDSEEDCVKDLTETKTNIFNQQVYNLAEQHKMNQIIDQCKNDEQLKTFKNQTMRFELNFIREVNKYFKTDFAVKIDVSLKIIHAHMKRQISKNKIQLALSNIWKEVPIIKEILFCYYIKWDFIRFHYQEWKAKTIRRNQK